MNGDVFGCNGLLVGLCDAPVLLADRDAPDTDGVALHAVGCSQHEVFVDLKMKLWLSNKSYN